MTFVTGILFLLNASLTELWLFYTWSLLLFYLILFFQCLSSSVAFGFGCSYIARYEEQAIGIQWSNLADTPIVDDEYSLLYCIIMMLVDSVIYGLITWYIEAVFPGKLYMCWSLFCSVKLRAQLMQYINSTINWNHTLRLDWATKTINILY